MKYLRKLFGNLFLKPQRSKEHKAIPREEKDREKIFITPYKKGDLIGGKYEVYDVLGKGGFGVVYLVYSHETKLVYALKTFRDEYFENTQTKERFRKEAGIWVDLERHPYLVRASFVDEFAGRFYIAMEYIAPDEQGLNSLDGYFRHKPPDFAQSLRWAIQFCYGIEYAYSKGMFCHRDIKPANILIGQDKTVKISDFGLAGVLDSARTLPEIKLSLQNDRIGLSFQTIDGSIGTPTHMPPEQFIHAAYCDERSDIYSFGIVLYQMRNGGKVPFLAQLPKDNSDEEALRFWNTMRRLHTEAPVPQINSRLYSLIYRCLEKEANNRYQTFKQLRLDIELLLRRQTGELFEPPKIRDIDFWEWNNKGNSLGRLGRHEEAIQCFDKALEINPQFFHAWSNKGNSLNSLDRYQEAIMCYDKDIEINPLYAPAMAGKGVCFNNLGRFEEAIDCFDQAIQIDPTRVSDLTNKGYSLFKLYRIEESISCYDRAIEIDPGYSLAWNNKGTTLQILARYEEALHCFGKLINLDKNDAYAWNAKGAALKELGRLEEAIKCYDKAIELDPRHSIARNNKAIAEEALSRKQNNIK